MAWQRLALVAVTLVVASSCQYVGTRGPHTTFHGDSMGAQADRQITNQLTREHRLLRLSRERAKIATMLPHIRSAAQGSPQPRIAIIGLGAGDAHERHGDGRMRRDIRRALDAVRHVPCVRWLNLKVQGVNPWYQGYVARAGDFNRILAREIRDYPNARIAPYRQWANQNAGAFKADGLHHTEAGKTRYARFIRGVALNCPSAG